MKTYEVYFTLYGKKMKKVVIAKNKEHAEEIIKDSIKFDKITECEVRDDNIFQDLMNIVEGKK